MLHEPSIMPEPLTRMQVTDSRVVLLQRSSALVDGAGVGRPAADRAAQQRRAVLRAVQHRDRAREVRSPVCEPPRRPRMRSVSRIARCSRFTSSSVERRRPARAGSMPARQSASSQSRLPRPAMRDWSMITAFTGARLLRGDRAQLARA